MSSNLKTTLTFILTLLLSFVSMSQDNRHKWEIGAGLSLFLYQGDLTPEQFGASKTMRTGVYLFGSKILSPAFSLRTNLAIGSLKGDDAKYASPAYRRQRNFQFKSSLVELSQWIVWNPRGKNDADRGFYPYFFTGAGLSFVKTRRDWSNFNAEYFTTTDVAARLAEDAAHSPPEVIPFIPVGAGLRFHLGYRWAVNAESTYRLLFTDYLDGFSIAANPDKKDKYHSVSVGAVYRVGRKNLLGCPVVTY